jgi:hypothetical protein
MKNGFVTNGCECNDGTTRIGQQGGIQFHSAKEIFGTIDDPASPYLPREGVYIADFDDSRNEINEAAVSGLVHQ